MEKKNKVVKEKKLEDLLFDCRNDLRGVGSLDKNRDAVISMVFLKSSTDKFNKVREKIMQMPDYDEFFLEQPSFYKAENAFYLRPECRWEWILDHASANGIAADLDKILKTIESDNELLKDALPTNLYTDLNIPKDRLKRLIEDINKINPETYGPEDLVGRVYEYFLQLYAASGTKEDGEFYTPVCLVELIAELIEPYEGTIYDPCCGTGGMYVQAVKVVDKHKGNRNNISILGQELNSDTWKLAKMNLASRGISYDLGAQPASTFSDDQHPHRKVNYVMANPPFNLKNWRGDSELLDDPRWSGFGVPPVSNANYAWILHIISKLDVNNGVAGFLLANGALKPDGEEANILKNILNMEKCPIEAIIVCPRDMFYTTDISVTLWILNMNKKASVVNGRKLRDRQNEILFMDLRTWNQNIGTVTYDKGKNKKSVILMEDQRARVKEIYNSWQEGVGYEDIPELCKSVKIKLTEEEKNGEAHKNDLTVESKGWVLTPSKYIDFIDHDMEIDYEKEMANIQKEMSALISDEKKFDKEIVKIFEELGYGIKENKN